MVKFALIVSALFALTLAIHQKQPKNPKLPAQLVRLNKINQINQSSDSSSSEADSQSPVILKTTLYDPKKCKLVPPPTSDELTQFHEWTLEHNKTYPTAEEHICRTINVILSIREIYEHNKIYDDGKIKFRRRLNSLSDLTTKERNYRVFMANPSGRTVDLDDYPDLPEPRQSVDYREEGLVGPIGLQIKCNSCYAWSSAAVLEGQLRKCGISRQAVSVQSMVDCTTESCWHCRSGFPYSVFRWGMKNGILPANKYPYQDQDEQCNYNKSDVLAYVDIPYDYDFYNSDNGAEYMKKLVSHYGPIASGLCSSSSFEDYSEGVYDEPKCCKKANHAIAIVGYGTDPKDGDYWLIKNSWGPTWGDNGFGKIARGKNMCAFENEVYFSQLRDNAGKVCSIFS